MEECVRFARRSRHRVLTLWPNDMLEDARRVYERAGFELVEEGDTYSCGRDLVGGSMGLEL